MRNLFFKYRETIAYVFFGAVTTLVNLVVFKLFNMILGEELYLISNTIAWAAAVLVAFFTNKLWVFESKSWAPAVLRRELPAFVGARVFSYAFEEAGLFLTVGLLGLGEWALALPFVTFSGEMVCKVFLQVVVLVLNYVFSKLVIFKKSLNDRDGDGKCND